MKLFLFSILLKLTLELSFCLFVIPNYSIFEPRFNTTIYILGWIFYIILLKVLPQNSNQIGSLLFLFLFYLFILPSFIFVAYCDDSTSFLLLTIASFLISYFISKNKKLKNISVKNFLDSRRLIFLLAFFLSIQTLWIFVSGGYKYISFDFYKIYEYRYEVSNLLNKSFFSYYSGFVYNVAGTLCFALLLYKKHFTKSLLCFLLFVFWFGVTGHKQILFNCFLILGLFVILASKKHQSYRLPLGLILAICCSLINFMGTKNLFLADMIIRRIFFDPVQVAYTYYHFFRQNELTWWSENLFFNKFLTYPYDEPSTRIISKLVGYPDGNANASYLATGFMHAGFIGVLIYASILGFIVRFLNYHQNTSIPLFLSMSCIVCPFLALFTSADLTTSMLTHSLAFSLVIYLAVQKLKV